MRCARSVVYVAIFLLGAAVPEARATLPDVVRFRGDADYPPFEYLDEQGQPAGFNVEIVRAVAAAAGLEVTIDLGPWSEVRRQVETGEIHALAGMYQTTSRDAAVDFTSPHLIVSYAVFVRAGSPIRSLEDARRSVILVQHDDLGHDFLLESGITDRIVTRAQWQDVLVSLAGGAGDCAVVSRLQGLRLIDELELDNIHPVGGSVIQRRYGFAVRQGEPELRAALEEGLSIIRTNGVYEEIYQAWFGRYEPRRPARYLVWILLPLVAAVVLSVAWSWSLRRQVRRRTAELESELAERRRAQAELLDRLSFEQLLSELSTAFADRSADAAEGEIDGALSAVARHFRALGAALCEIGPERDGVRLLYGSGDGWSELRATDNAPAALLAGQEVMAGATCAVPLRTGDEVSMAILLVGPPERTYWSSEVAQRVRLVGEVIAGVVARARAERQKRVLEGRLLQAQKLEAIGTLAGGIAHDFNNILAAIIGYVQLAQEALPPQAQASQDLAAVMTAARRAADLVQQILTFSRHGSESKRPFALQPPIEEAVHLLRASIPTTVAILCDLEPDPLHVVADPGQVQQVLMNLCTNSFHALPEQRGRIAIALRRAEPEDAGLAALTVSDDGTGMSAEVAGRCFEPFFTTKDPGRGTGLGLSVVYGIVTDLGGRVAIDSTPGRGTRVTILLPLVAAPPFEGAVAENLPPRGAERILLVDDEPALADLGAKVLGGLGYRVDTRTSPREAYVALQADPHAFDLLITDQTMPGLTGGELIELARSLRSDLPAVLCTGHSDRLDERAALALGACAFLMKPFDRATLAAAVRRALDTKAAGVGRNLP